MWNRFTKDLLICHLKNSSSVALLGPRQVGKTTMALSLLDDMSAVYIDLEDRQDRQKVENIKEFYRANKNRLIILDEVQRLPHVFEEIRGVIDAERRADHRDGLFLFLGSASLDLLRQSGESLAGRISYVELYPMNALEYMDDRLDLERLDQLWLRGGFPESLLKQDDAASNLWRENFIKTYLERDIPQFGPRVPAVTMERLWTMLAHGQGTRLNASKLAASLEVSNMSITRYVDLLVDLLLVRKLYPYTFNIKKRLVKTPRVYIRDSGLTHSLLNIKSYNDLLGHPVVGKSWEGFVIENICSMLPERVKPYYYRTAGGAEIDLVLEFGLDELWAIEIKRGWNTSLSRGFYEACQDLNPRRKIVIHSGEGNWPKKDNIEAMSLHQFLYEISLS